MDIDIKTWLFDILQVIEEINSFVESISDDFNRYKKDTKTRRAVERNLGIIGEAMTRIVKKEPTVQLTEIRMIIATRNKIIHGYEQVSDKVIWAIVRDDLPTLKSEVESLIGNDDLQ